MWVEWVFIPTILGYAWLSTSYTERYDLFRISGHHVFFRSVIEGYGVFFIAYKGDRGLTLPMSEIVSPRFFDQEIYQSYQS